MFNRGSVQWGPHIVFGNEKDKIYTSCVCPSVYERMLR